MTSSLKSEIEKLNKKVVSRGDLPYISVQEQLDIIKHLSAFPLGRFFIERKGANGFWTDYIINFPNAAVKNKKSGYIFSNEVERFILTKCPLTLATQDRFKIFQVEAQKCLRDGIVLASIPCGLMRDLCSLDFSKITDYLLMGVDLDPLSLRLAEDLAKEYALKQHPRLIQQDAWSLKFNSEIGLITSNGLNVYISERKKLLELYNVFFRSLRENGVLIMGFLPPPYAEDITASHNNPLPREDVLMETVIFEDILGCKWRNFTTESEIRKDLFSVGFRDIRVIYDKYRIFPTLVAKR